MAANYHQAGVSETKSQATQSAGASLSTRQPGRFYGQYLLLVAGLGGLLYGIDVGIIGGALPYLEATSHLSSGELSIIVAAVLLGSVFSTLFAGMLADWLGRKPLMLVSGIVFILSIPIIARSDGFTALLIGRLLQGISAGLIGVVAPLYLAECLGAEHRGKGTGIFQWMLTLGIVAAALVGIYYSYRVGAVESTGNVAAIFAYKNQAWRRIFWASLAPGILFTLGCLGITESPRWLYRRKHTDEALSVLLRTRSPKQAQDELAAFETTQHFAKKSKTASDSLLRRKYVVPFLLACVILFCNTATGINSIIGYNADILLQSGLGDLAAHWGYVIFTAVNFCMTIVGMTLIDRRGRKFLLSIGTAGVVISLIVVGLLFRQSEQKSIDVHEAVQAMVQSDRLTMHFDPAVATSLLQNANASTIDTKNLSLVITYSYGGFTAATSAQRSDEASPKEIVISRDKCLPASNTEAHLKNPFADLEAARLAPLRIDRAVLTPLPTTAHGWRVAMALYLFMAFFAMGPGVCVWLALSELMPARIRSNGMSIALVINQLVSTTLAGIFLPFVSRFGYSSIFFLFASFSLLYFLVSTFLLPETKGKTLEDIEAYFSN